MAQQKVGRGLMVWDNPEAAALRDQIDADVIIIEKALSNLQMHLLALKVLSKNIATERSLDIARDVSITETIERDAHTAKKKNWPDP